MGHKYLLILCQICAEDWILWRNFIRLKLWIFIHDIAGIILDTSSSFFSEKFSKYFANFYFALNLQERRNLRTNSSNDDITNFSKEFTTFLFLIFFSKCSSIWNPLLLLSWIIQMFFKKLFRRFSIEFLLELYPPFTQRLFQQNCQKIWMNLWEILRVIPVDFFL